MKEYTCLLPAETSVFVVVMMVMLMTVLLMVMTIFNPRSRPALTEQTYVSVVPILSCSSEFQ